MGNTLLHYIFLSEQESLVGEIVGRIMEIDCMLAMRKNNAGTTPWILAARHGNIPGLSVLATYHSVTVLDRGDTTALHEASRHGQTATIRFLTEVLRCDIFSMSIERRTPISEAAIGGHIDSFQELLNRNADPLQDGQTLALGLKHGRPEFIQRLLSYPFFMRILDADDWLEPLAKNPSAAKFLQEFLHLCIPSDLCHLTTDGYPLLMVAAQHFNHVGFESLLVAGADPLLPGPFGMNLLHVIALHERLAPFATLLVRYCGEAVSVLITACDRDGDTPCHVAARRQNTDFIRAILQNGPLPVMPANGKGLTVMDLANDEIRLLLTGATNVAGVEKTRIPTLRHGFPNEIQGLLTSLIDHGFAIPPDFRPTSGRLLASLVHFASQPVNQNPGQRSLVERFLGSWSRARSGLWYHCVLYLQPFMIGANLEDVIGFLELITTSRLSATAEQWIEAILRSLTCSVNPPGFEEVLKASEQFVKTFALSEFLPRPLVAEPMASLICRLMNWSGPVSADTLNIQLKWIRFLPIAHSGPSFGHIWDSSDSLAANLYKNSKSDPAAIDWALTACNHVLDSTRLWPDGRDAVLKALLSCGTGTDLRELAPLMEDICLSFGASFVADLRINEFVNPIAAMRQFLALRDDPLRAASILRITGPKRDVVIQEASQSLQASCLL
jgi:ankyrin repeat protein